MALGELHSNYGGSGNRVLAVVLGRDEWVGICTNAVARLAVQADRDTKAKGEASPSFLILWMSALGAKRTLTECPLLTQSGHSAAGAIYNQGATQGRD